jgi:hypothetical protein
MDEMIAAYVTEVGRRLPEKQRADIEREIRSMIEDTLEDESRTQGRPVDEELVVSVLKRLGSPEKLAASYAPPRYLVGPELYPSYVLSLKLVLGIVLLLSAIGLAVTAALGAGQGSGADAPVALLRGLGLGGLNLINVGIQVFGMVTIIFAIIQWAAPGFKAPAVSPEFDPRQLKIVAEPESEPFRPLNLAIGMTLPLLALALFNFYPQLVGMYIYKDGQWQVYQIFTAAFFGYLPFMSILWTLEAVFKGSVLAAGRWTPALKWMALGLKALGLGMIYVILTGPDIVLVPAAAIINPGGSDIVALFNYWVNFSVRLALGIALVVSIVELGVKIVKLVMGRKNLGLAV